jgi:hypothetical protein
MNESDIAYVSLLDVITTNRTSAVEATLAISCNTPGTRSEAKGSSCVNNKCRVQSQCETYAAFLAYMVRAHLDKRKQAEQNAAAQHKVQTRADLSYLNIKIDVLRNAV